MKKHLKSFGQKLSFVWQYKTMEYMVYAMVTVIPLFVGKYHWFPFSAPKALLIYLFTGSMLGLFGWGMISHNDISPSFRITPIHGALLIFLVVLVIGGLVGIDPHNSFFGVWSQSISIMMVITVSIFACLVGFLIRRDNQILIKLLTTAFLASVIFSSITYFGDRAIAMSRWGGTLGNSSFAGAYLLFTICFGIGLLIWYKKIWQKLVIGIGLAIILFSPVFFNNTILTGAVSVPEVVGNPLLVLGQANAAAVGVVVSIVTIVLFFMITHRRMWARVVGLVMFVIFLGGMFYVGTVLVDPQSSLHHRISQEKTGNRFLFWDIARDGFVQNPILGNGFNNYIYTFHNHYRTEFYQTGFIIEEWTNQPHNMFWEYMSTTGILGTLNFFMLLVLVVITLYLPRKEHDDYRVFKIVMIGGMVGYFVQNLFGFDVPITYLFLFLVIGMAIGLSEKHWIIHLANKYRFYQVLGSVFVLTGIVGVIIFGILPWRESLQWRKATNRNTITTSLDHLASLQSMSLLGGVADSAFLMDVFFDNYQNEIIQTVVKTTSTDILVNVENFLGQELQRQPYNYRAHMVRAKVMIMRMFLDKSTVALLWERAHEHIKQAQKINSQNPNTYLVQVQLYVVKNDVAKARAYTRAALALAPEYLPGYTMARDVNKLQPDKLFMDYVATMKSRWGIVEAE